MRRLTTTAAASVLALMTLAAPAHGGPGDPVDDTTPPVITFTKPAPVWNGWYAGDTVVGYSAKDPASGVASLEHVLSGATIGSGTGPTNITIHAEGRTTLTVTATDFEGNVATASTDIPIDRSGPVISATIADGVRLARNSLVRLDYSCADQLTVVITCDGSVESGSLLDTASPGPHTISLRGIDAVGNASTRQLTYVVNQGALVALDRPTIQGTPQVGRVLTAAGGRFDPTPDSITYTWFRDGVPSGTGTTREVVPQDVGARFYVVASAVKADWGSTDSPSNPTAPVIPGAFNVSETGAIHGEAEVGRTLTFTAPTVTPSPATTTNTWVRDGQILNQGLTHELTAADLNGHLAVVTTLSRPGYTDLTLTSEPTSAVAPGTYVLDRPSSLTGTAELGAILRAVDPQVSPTPAAVTHQWLRDGTPISGATGTNYQVAVADIGHRIALLTTATSAAGEYRPLSSASSATAVVPKVQTRLQVGARARRGQRVVATVSVAAAATSVEVPLTGMLTVTDGKKVLASRAVTSGPMRITLTHQRRGKHRYVVTYTGSSTVEGSTARTRTIRVP